MRMSSAAIIVAIALASCATASSGDAPPAGATPTNVPEASTTVRIDAATITNATTSGTSFPSNVETGQASCGDRSGSAFREEVAVALEPLDSGASFEILAAEYPLPGPTEGLWSQWGQGIVSSVNGRHYSAVGDHLGPDGNSYIYEYDPARRTLARISDILSLVDHQPGAWGYGKIHSQMVEDRCGSIWTFTYWGTRTDMQYGNGYKGDLLIEIDPEGRTVRNHGALVGERGVPSLAITRDGRYLVAEAVDADTDDGDLVVVDVANASLVQVADDPDHIGFRALAVDHQGRVLYSTADGSLMALIPDTGETVDIGIRLPGGESEFLRAATPVMPTGSLYGVSQYGYELFAIDEDGSLEVIGNAEEYTTSLAVTPEGDRLFWMPGAHGDAWEMGAPILQLDTATGEITELVSLVEPFEESLGLRPGGSYSITYHEGSLIIGLNASTLDDDSGFGTVVLVVIEGV